MDRHVEFATQLSRLVELYARNANDEAAERAAVRSARAAAKHGAIELSAVDLELRAGPVVVGDDVPSVHMLRDLFATLGITRFHVAHQAKQDEIKAIARLLADAVPGGAAAEAFVTRLAEREWADIRVEDGAGTAVSPTAATDPTDATAAEPIPEVGLAPAESDGADPVAAPLADLAPAGPEAEGEAEPAELLKESAPLATRVPAAVEELPEARHRELFERLITSSEPVTLRRLLDPIQLAIEQSLREGRVSEAVQLLLAMFACEGLTADPEMRRHFVVLVRRITKPTVLRAFAMLFADEPQFSDSVERVLVRFGEDGAEAVADRVSCAPSAAGRAQYAALLGRLPGARDAVLAMLDDQRPHVVERAIALAVQLRFVDADRVLGEQLNHASVRVRQAAAQGLAAFPTSAFAADALLRALPDESPEVRLTATVALKARRESRLAPTLVQRLEEETELDIQLALVAALGRLAVPEGVQKLIALASPEQRNLRRRDASVLRLSAIEALGEARTPAAMIALQKLLEDREAEVREAAGRLFTRARRQTTTGSIASVSEP